MKSIIRRFDLTAIALVAAMAVLLSAMFLVSAPKAHAQVSEERLEALQKQVTELLAIVESLQEQLKNFNPSDRVRDRIKDRVADDSLPKPCPYVWKRSLYRGASGDDVKDLQRMLHKFGYYDEEETGYFGEVTEEALKKFQRAKNIVTDGDANTTGYGMFGPLTRAMMHDKCAGSDDNDHRKDVFKKRIDYIKDKKHDNHKKDDASDDGIEDYDDCVDAGGEIWSEYDKCEYNDHYYYDEDATDDEDEDEDEDSSDVTDYDSCVDADGEVWSDYDKCEYDGDYYYEDVTEDEDSADSDTSDVDDYESCVDADGTTYTDDDGVAYKCEYDGKYHYAE